MNRTRTLALGVALAAGLFPYAATAQVAKNVDGLVTKVDEPAEKITIRHGPLKEFDMPDGMTMVFRAGDKAMLKLVKAGDRERFDLERISGTVHGHADRKGAQVRRLEIRPPQRLPLLRTPPTLWSGHGH